MKIKQSSKFGFEGISLSEAGRKSESLRRDLKAISNEVDLRIERDDPENQDFGATLVLVLGAPAVVAIARGIESYLQRAGGTIMIEANGNLVAKNIAGSDIAKIEEALSKRR